MIISCNGPPFEHDSLKKLLKDGLASMYGKFFHKHFVHVSNMSKFFALKFIHKIENPVSIP